MYLVLIFVWILESSLNIFNPFFGFCSFKFFLYFLGCCAPVPIHLPCCQCQPVLSSCWEKKKMAIGKLVGVLHITTFTKGLSILTCWVLTCSPGVVLLQFWARVRVSAWLFYSNCLDLRLYFCQFLFWCSFMWFVFVAVWRALLWMSID